MSRQWLKVIGRKGQKLLKVRWMLSASLAPVVDRLTCHCTSGVARSKNVEWTTDRAEGVWRRRLQFQTSKTSKLQTWLTPYHPLLPKNSPDLHQSQEHPLAKVETTCLPQSTTPNMCAHVHPTPNMCGHVHPSPPPQTCMDMSTPPHPVRRPHCTPAQQRGTCRALFSTREQRASALAWK